MGFDTETPWPGVLVQHHDGCPARYGAPCTCGGTGFRARIDDPHQAGPTFGPTFATPDQASTWRREQQHAFAAWHAAGGGGGVTVSDVVDEFLNTALAGDADDERGTELADLRWSLRALKGIDAADPRVRIGQLPIAALDARELRALVDRLESAGLPAQHTRSMVDALRSLLRFAAYRGLVPARAAELLAFGGPGEVPTTATMPVAQQPTMPPRPPLQPTHGWAPSPPAPAPALGDPSRPAATPATIPDEVIWMILKIVALVFALIALVLVAESV
jgi:hypothetical protein